MAGKNPQKALEAYLTPLERAVACITFARLQHDYHGGAPSKSHSLSLGPVDGTASIQATPRPLVLLLQQRFEIVKADGDEGPFKVSTLAYNYGLDTEDGSELVRYHWHPTSGHKQPHLHLGSASGELIANLQKAHIPTARISVEDFLMFAFRDFKATPAKTDYLNILAASRSRFERWKRW